jgi:hypothetical protein
MRKIMDGHDVKMDRRWWHGAIATAGCLKRNIFVSDFEMWSAGIITILQGGNPLVSIPISERDKPKSVKSRAILLSQ